MEDVEIKVKRSTVKDWLKYARGFSFGAMVTCLLMVLVKVEILDVLGPPIDVIAVPSILVILWVLSAGLMGFGVSIILHGINRREKKLAKNLELAEEAESLAGLERAQG